MEKIIPSKRLKSSSSSEEIKKKPKIKAKQSSANHYGIGMFGIKKESHLDNEADWKRICKCDELYVPTYKIFHRNTIFLIYYNKNIRDEMINDENLQKVDNITVDKVEFTIDRNIDSVTIINSYLLELKTKFHTRPSQQEKNEIKRKSMKVLSECYEMLKSSADSMNGSLNPDDLSLQWFLYCEVLFFLIYKLNNAQSPSTDGNLGRLFDFSWIEFSQKLKALSQETKIYVIDILWQAFFYKKELDSNLWLGEIFWMLSRTENLSRLAEIESNLHIFREILLCPIFKNILLEFISPLDKSTYANNIDTIINNTFSAEFPINNHGVTLMNKFIVIDQNKVFNNNLSTSGYRLIILIHEIAHMSARMNCNSAKQCIEYDSDESSFAELPLIKTNQENKPESGYQLEKRIFGCVLKKLNTIAAEFLMDINNWSLCDFQSQFQQLNSQQIKSDGTTIESIRMRVNDENLDFIDLGEDWCFTSYLKRHSK